MVRNIESSWKPICERTHASCLARFKRSMNTSKSNGLSLWMPTGPLTYGMPSSSKEKRKATNMNAHITLTRCDGLTGSTTCRKSGESYQEVEIGLDSVWDVIKGNMGRRYGNTVIGSTVNLAARCAAAKGGRLSSIKRSLKQV